MGLQAALQSYAGPEYSQEPLDKAEKLLKNIVKFPEESRREKEAIDRAYTIYKTIEPDTNSIARCFVTTAVKEKQPECTAKRS